DDAFQHLDVDFQAFRLFTKQVQPCLNIRDRGAQFVRRVGDKLVLLDLELFFRCYIADDRHRAEAAHLQRDQSDGQGGIKNGVVRASQVDFASPGCVVRKEVACKEGYFFAKGPGALQNLVGLAD